MNIKIGIIAEIGGCADFLCIDRKLRVSKGAFHKMKGHIAQIAL